MSTRNTYRLVVIKLRSNVNWNMPKATIYKDSILPSVPMIKPKFFKSLTAY